MSNEHHDEKPIDTLALLRAEIDQMVKLAPEIARNAHGWFEAFLHEGFTERQALYLAATMTLQKPGEAPA